MLVDWNRRIVTESDNGFPDIRGCEIPARINGDWTAPVDYARGRLHMRMEIRRMPVSKAMNWQWCFHQDGTAKEECSSRSQTITGPAEGGPPVVVTWLSSMAYLSGKNYGGPIDWNRPRSILNLVLRKGGSGTQYLSPYASLNGGNAWAGEDPAEWFPMEVCFTAVLVAEGAAIAAHSATQRDRASQASAAALQLSKRN